MRRIVRALLSGPGQTSTRLFARLFAILALATLLLASCGDGVQEGHLRLGDPENAAAICPDANLASVPSVIFVSPKGTDSASCGHSIDGACRSIAQGLANCSGERCSVLVQHGLYPTSASINLRDGVNLVGSCRFNGEADLKYRTVIQAAPAAGTAAIVGSGINSPTTVSGLVVIGKDETTPGAASIALALDNSRGLTLLHSTLAPGRGGDGATGASVAGGAGGAGLSPTCTNSMNCRGAGGPSCPANPSPIHAGDGGQGGAANLVINNVCILGQCSCDDPAPPLHLGMPGIDSGAAKGGAGGQFGGNGCNCTNALSRDPGPGSDGSRGQAGACATQGGTKSADLFGSGSFQGLVWRGGAGGDGTEGMRGAGGGGGGAGGASAPRFDLAGIPGGGGGGGGCGGSGGKGGQQGGASIPLVLLNSTLNAVANANSLIPAPGGTGGTGGRGGAGGPGGAGGVPTFTNGPVSGDGPGCGSFIAPGLGGHGGPGGIGGAGAGGAGGNGGPSFAIALVGDSPVPNNVGLYSGIAGAPGAKGAGGSNPHDPDINPSPCTGAGGEDGRPGGEGAMVMFTPG